MSARSVAVAGVVLLSVVSCTSSPQQPFTVAFASADGRALTVRTVGDHRFSRQYAELRRSPDTGEAWTLFIADRPDGRRYEQGELDPMDPAFIGTELALLLPPDIGDDWVVCAWVREGPGPPYDGGRRCVPLFPRA